MIELQLPADAPDTALDELRKVIREHAPVGYDYGERVAVNVGKRRIELGRRYRVDGSPECLAALMRAIDAAQ